MGEGPVRPISTRCTLTQRPALRVPPRGVNTETRAASRAALFRIRAGAEVHQPAPLFTRLLITATCFTTGSPIRGGGPAMLPLLERWLR